MDHYLETTVDKFVFRVAADCLYRPDGVWVQSQGSRIRVGLTDYVQQRGGDVAFVHLKPVGTKLAAGDEFVEIETIKTTVSLALPIGGTVVEINPALELSPEIINEEPYGKGWLAVVEAVDWDTERAKLLDAQAYLSAMKRQAEQELNGS